MAAFEGETPWNLEANSLSFEEITKQGESRIVLAGPRRSGKSSIERVVFHKMSPHETLFLESTHNVDVHLVSNNDLIRFQTWDFGGDLNLNGEVSYHDKSISTEQVLKNCNTLIYVIDAQEEDYEDALPKLVETISAAHHINPGIHFEVFLHKVDGDFMSEETKAERQQGIQHYVSSELQESNGDVLVSYYLTSIYDHSALEALSKVVQKLVPQLPTLNNLLDIMISSCNIDKSYLVDVVTKLYIATDSNPVDVHTYELCSDLVDVVIDVSCIYGVNVKSQSKGDASGGEGDGAVSVETIPYDDDSTAAIRLGSGMVLYLREVSSYLALVCIIREEYFAKRALLDYNINCFKQSLEKVNLKEGLGTEAAMAAPTTEIGVSD
jgi:Ras-related GTP-binding protein C/D